MSNSSISLSIHDTPIVQRSNQIPSFWGKLIFLSTLLWSVTGICFGQNLAPNWSFEQYDECPSSSGGSDPLPCFPWTHAGTGSPDYFNACADNSWPDVPTNGFGYQFANTGDGYTGVWCRIDGFEEYREYLHAPLNSPMIVGNTYHVSFYVNLSNTCCGTSNMGAYFSVAPPASNDWFPIPVTPQVAHPGSYISDTTEWTLVMGCFTPTAAHQFISIGNFYDDAATPVDPDCALSTDHSYYYIEDVVVLPMPSGGVGELDLGPPVTACQSHTIESGISNVVYQWSTGSYQPSIDVTTSGTYYLTVTGGCTVQIDSVEVEIVDYIPFDIGQDEITLCAGDTFFISLDPDHEVYTWNDGAQGPEYFITSSGTYSVTLDNGCITTDEIVAEVIPPPASPWLGPDTVICPQEEIVIALDPGLGDFLWQDNSTSAQYNITGPGTYALTITNSCGNDTDEVIIDQGILPDLDIDDDPFLLCAGTMDTIFLDPDAGTYVWGDGSTDSFYPISESGLYSVTLTNQCGDDVADIEVEELHVPVFDLGNDLTLCANQFPYTLDPGDVPYAQLYDWGNGNTNQQLSISAPGVYSLTVSNDCFFATDEIEVFSLQEIPAFALPDDTLLCPGDTILLSADNLPGNYLWQDSSSMPYFHADTAGMYALTISNSCSAYADTIIIAMAPLVETPDLGADFSLCPGEEAVLTVGVNAESFLWQDLSAADTLHINSPGLYYITAFGLCDSASDTVLVSLNQSPPQLALADELLLCQGDAILVEAQVSGVNYVWNDGSTLSTILVTQPGTYSLTISNACGTDQDTVIVSDGGPAPFVELGNDTSFCAGEVISLIPDYANTDTWLWSDGSTMPNFDISAPGQITVQVSNTCGAAFDTINATLLPAVPQLDLGADTAVCPGETILLTISIPDVDILWSDGSIGSTLLTSDEGVYFASITNTCGVSYDTMELTFLPDIPPLNLGPDQSLCPGETVTIDPGINGVDYLWHDGSTLATYSTTQEETIILTITNACGTISDTLEVIENNQGPVVDLGPDILACEGEIITIPAGISGVNYLWQDGSTASSFSTSVSGELILQVSNACGTDADTILVDIHGTTPVVDLGIDTTLCEGEILVLTSSAISENTIVWHDGSGSETYEVSSEGTYSLFESNHCGEDTDTVIISYTEAPQPFDLGADTVLCPDESIILSAPITSDEILWQDGSDQLTIIADQPQTYWLQISNACGLTSDSIVVAFDDTSPVLHLATSISFCEGDVFTLDATQPFAANYQWSNGAISSSIDVTTPDLYSVIVSTLCQSISQEIDIYPGYDCVEPEVNDGIYIPNVFSPNQDGVNDVFTVSHGPDLNVVAMQGNVYDRLGNLVYSSQEIPFTWDGNFVGETVLPGVYVYVITLRTQTGQSEKEIQQAGEVTLIR